MPPVIHSPRSVLVTGGAGFIGSNLVRTLVPLWPDATFVNLDAVTYAGRPSNVADLERTGRYRFVKGDITDQELVDRLFAEHAFSTVLHLAAESHVDRSIMDPLAFVRTNVIGTAVLLDAARRAWRQSDGSWPDVRFHHVSTDEVFGSLGSEGFFTEETAYDPRSPYAASKAGSDHLVRAWGHTYGLPVVISNSSNNYGPYQYPEKLIPLVIQNAVEKKPVPVYGRGANVRDWLFVEDHCRAIATIARHAENGSSYLVSGGEERTNIDLVGLLLDLVDEALGREAGFGRSLIRFVTDRPGHDFRYALDGRRIEQDLGWKPSVSLSEGLRSTVGWYLENGAWMSEVRDEAYQTYYASQYDRR